MEPSETTRCAEYGCNNLRSFRTRKGKRMYHKYCAKHRKIYRKFEVSDRQCAAQGCTRQTRIRGDGRRSVYCDKHQKINSGYSENRYNRNRYLKQQYGITIEEQDRIKAEQGNKCAICRAGFSSDCVITVDHDHNTGSIRGLLCSQCNTWLGGIENFLDKGLIYRAFNYLSEKSKRDFVAILRRYSPASNSYNEVCE